MNPLKPHIVLAGGSGFIGRHLARHLLQAGYAVTILSRSPAMKNDAREQPHLRWVCWDGRTLGPWAACLENAAGLINLAGQNVNCRYHARNRQAILNSRLDSTRILGQACRQCSQPPKVWIQSSTLAIHSDRGDEVLTETSPIGTGFSPSVAKAWEDAAIEAAGPDIRQVILRISFVLGRDGGALPMLAKLARMGLGGSVGDGKQYYSWIHIDDLAGIILQAILHPSMQGLYNATSPAPVRNTVFMKLVRQTVGRGWSPPAPRWAIHLGCWLMRTEPELALRSCYGLPARLAEAGFRFTYPTLEEALDNLYPSHAAARSGCLTTLYERL